MVVSTWVLIALMTLGPIPQKIYFRDGRWLENRGRLEFKQGICHYRAANGQTYRWPCHLLDLVRTFTPQARAPATRTRYRGVPWDHPAYARKTHSPKRIALTTEGLLAFVAKHPRRYHEAGPEPQGPDLEEGEPLPNQKRKSGARRRRAEREQESEDDDPPKPKRSKRKPASRKRSLDENSEDSFPESEAD